MIVAILVSIVTGLIVNEFCELSPWCARKLVRWSAFRLYSDPARAQARAEELAAVINNRPGKLFKLITALCFVAKAAFRPLLAGRSIPTRAELPDRPAASGMLTERQLKILLAIRDSVQRRGYPPSIREIGETVGLTSASSVSYQLSVLQRKGYLKRIDS